MASVSTQRVRVSMLLLLLQLRMLRELEVPRLLPPEPRWGCLVQLLVPLMEPAVFMVVPPALVMSVEFGDSLVQLMEILSVFTVRLVLVMVGILHHLLALLFEVSLQPELVSGVMVVVQVPTVSTGITALPGMELVGTPLQGMEYTELLLLLVMVGTLHLLPG